MKFDKNKYLKEMTAMVDKAVQRLSTEKHDFEIYSLSIWTDPSAKMSSINFDSKKNSDQKVAKSNEWNKKYYDKHIAQGDLEQAKLFEPIKTRNCNPADFEIGTLKSYQMHPFRTIGKSEQRDDAGTF